MDLDDVSDLDDGVRVGGWEFALLCRALNIKAQNAQWRNLRVLSVAGQALDIVVVVDVKLDLTVGVLLLRGTDLPLLCRYCDPRHPANFVVNHKPERIQHIRLKSSLIYAQLMLVTWEPDSFLEVVAELRNKLRVLNVDLQKPGLLVRVVHD